ncbi:hypothetical protein [Mangrovibacter phragmitis]|uniref:hypothetical protein n=1 Tax=Mangrovibacter phragmitis TaxID=1691903 RepID=UPI0009ED6DB2|nr:hypothetical protein [Mangrovibacter phragmitis]
MRAFQFAPALRAASPPRNRRWAQAGMVLVLLSVTLSLVLAGEKSSPTLLVVTASFASALVLLCWLSRQLYYRTSLHLQADWQYRTDQEYAAWWQHHTQTFALQDVVLIGPAGVSPADWQGFLNQPPGPSTGCSSAITNGLLFSTRPGERETQLAQMLARQWHTQCSGQVYRPPISCYWQGSETAWQAFSAEVSLLFPSLCLPVHPEPWQGANTLAGLAAHFALTAEENQQWFLVAGCLSVPAGGGSEPAGESALLWKVTAKGPVTLARGEVFSQGKHTATQVCQQAQQQSGLTHPPEHCVLFSPAIPPDFAHCGWNLSRHAQDPYWGRTGENEPLIAVSLAALLALHQQTSCGWIATDPQYQLTLGIVKYHG